MRAALCAFLLFAAACAKTGSLAVVTVDAATPLADVQKLHLTATANGRTLDIDVPLSTHTIPPTHTFGIDLSPSLSGTLDVTLDAIDSTGATLATGTASGTIVKDGRLDLAITFGAASPDLSVTDLSSDDSESVNDDLVTVPPTFTSQSVSADGLSAVWAADATHIWASGPDSIDTFFSAGDDIWQQFQTNPYYPVTGLWGTDATHGWMVDTAGDIRVLNATGTAWGTAVEPPGPPMFSAVWGSSATDIWAVSSDAMGLVFHNTTGASTTAAWPLVHSMDNWPYYAVHGAAADDVYIVGGNGNIVRADGSANGYTYFNFGTGADLRGVRAVDGTHVYVVGVGGQIGFSIGNGMFTAQTVPASAVSTNFNAVWASSIHDIYVAGDNGTLLHSTGNGIFTAVTSGLENMTPPHALNAISGTGPNDIYITSDKGDILHGK
jgi:hypothetical protein